MKRNIEANELENVTGGLNFVYTKDVRRALIAEEEAARRQAEQEFSIEVSSHPRGLLGEIEDASDRMMDVLPFI